LIDRPKAEEPGVPELYVGNEAEFDEGGLEIGVFRIKGRFSSPTKTTAPTRAVPSARAGFSKGWKRICPPDGTSAGFRYSADRVHIVCPWHGYEYDLDTGALPTNGKVRLRTFEVTVRDGDVAV
jgi:nitrite reductase/ring-hydroxylating ferredoxin subunit